jgi:hypothetical protein
MATFKHSCRNVSREIDECQIIIAQQADNAALDASDFFSTVAGF